MTEQQADQLASAPEVGITAAQTRPGTRQRRTERDKATVALDKATRDVARLTERVAEQEAELAKSRAALASATKLADHLAAHPALTDEETI